MLKKLIVIVGSALLLAGCNIQSLVMKQPAGLEVNTTPSATVFLNGASVGTTPYTNKNLKPGNYTLKLVPADSTGTLESYETNLVMASQVSTVVLRTFAPSDPAASGYVLQLESDPSGKSLLSIVSDPDTVGVTLDGQSHGFTPIAKLETTSGSHQVTVVSPGYQEQDVTVNTAKGYNLIINFKLASQMITLAPAAASTPSASISPTPSPSPSGKPKPSVSPSPSPTTAAVVPKPYVVVNTTPTGWLRVRKDASGTADELGKANTGDKLPYLGTTTDSGWFEVSFNSQTGWVSGQYVTLVK